MPPPLLEIGNSFAVKNALFFIHFLRFFIDIMLHWLIFDYVFFVDNTRILLCGQRKGGGEGLRVAGEGVYDGKSLLYAVLVKGFPNFCPQNYGGSDRGGQEFTKKG